MAYPTDEIHLIERIRALVESKKELERKLQTTEAERIGLMRLISGEQIGVSTSIADTTTYGYGDLDFNGFWEYPVSEDVVHLFQKIWKRL